jgi:hypothetical protein
MKDGSTKTQQHSTYLKIRDGAAGYHSYQNLLKQVSLNALKFIKIYFSGVFSEHFVANMR